MKLNLVKNAVKIQFRKKDSVLPSIGLSVRLRGCESHEIVFRKNVNKPQNKVFEFYRKDKNV